MRMGKLFGFERVHELLRTASDRRGSRQRRAGLRPGRRHQRDLRHARCSVWAGAGLSENF